MTDDGEARSNGLGTAAMVLGIIALVLSFIPLLGLLSWVLAPLAVIFGIIAVLKPDQPHGTAIAGIATGGVALVICLLWGLVFGAALSNAATAAAAANAAAAARESSSNRF